MPVWEWMTLWHFLPDVKGAPLGLRQFLANESPVKMIKNVIFVLKTLKFLSWLFGLVENGLIRKTRLISKLWRHNVVNTQL